jgi:hypothetical protein
MRRFVLWTAVALTLAAPLALAASMNQSFNDPAGDATPNMPELDIINVTASLDDMNLVFDVKIAGKVTPAGNQYLCVANLNPTMVANPRYELSFNNSQFSAKFRLGDSSDYPTSTVGSSWSEVGIHLVAKRGETNAVTTWEIFCDTRHTYSGYTANVDHADKNSMPTVPPTTTTKKKGLPGFELAAVVSGLFVLAIWRRR